jgi:NAD(P)H-dependent FMN reductase
MPRLQVVIASTRPGRVGLSVGRWFAGQARAHGAFDVEVVDLLELDLPFMDEPNHPRLGSTPTSTPRTGAPRSGRPTRSCS